MSGSTSDFFRIGDSNTFFAQLRSACREDWRAYCGHEFVRRIGDGTLPRSSFRHYLVQDYVFLIHFARAKALAVYKSESLDEMRAAARMLDGILNHEMALHVEFCRGWGLGLEQMETTLEARANMAYTRFVLERGLAGDALDLHVALAPCIVGYAEIGLHLAPALEHGAQNPYREWIAMYAGEEYQAAASAAVDQLDRLAGERGGSGRFASLARTFAHATRLEIAFWDMGSSEAS